jgi:hypothetical protein
VYENKLVWMNGPFPVSTHDLTIFCGGLKGMIPPQKRGIADLGYCGEKQILAMPNSSNPKALQSVKSHARARQNEMAVIING